MDPNLRRASLTLGVTAKTRVRALRRAASAGFLAFLFLALAPGADAQTAIEPGVGTAPSFETYSFGGADPGGIESISLLTVPLTAQARIARRVSVQVTGRYARASMSRKGAGTVTVSGPTDTDLQVVVPLAGDMVVLTGIASLATGDPTFDTGEAELAGAVAADLLPFAISNWGTGGGIGGSVALARPVGPFGVGLSAGYVAAGDFEPLAGQPVRYQPGDMLRINGVVDRSFGESKGSVRLSYQHYSEDLLGGANLFRAGDRLEALGTMSFPVSRRSSALVYGGVLHRQRGTFLNDSRTAPSQNLFLLGGGLRVPYRGGTLTPDVRLRLFRQAGGQGDGLVAEIGGSGQWRSSSVTWGPTLRLRFGSVDMTQGSSSGFVGAEVGLSLYVGRSQSSGGL